jgi:hypothetical protein
MHRRKNYRKPVTTKLPASVGIATTGDVGTTGGNRGVMTAAILVVAAVAVAGRDAENFVLSAVAAEVAEIAIVVSAAVVVADVTGIAIPDLANCPSRRKACA